MLNLSQLIEKRVVSCADTGKYGFTSQRPSSTETRIKTGRFTLSITDNENFSETIFHRNKD